jgi:hypothetical protein
VSGEVSCTVVWDVVCPVKCRVHSITAVLLLRPCHVVFKYTCTDIVMVQ